MNKKIVIDAGHGGEDPGTIANGIVEKEVTLAISQYLKKRFDELGIESSLTRNSDVTLGPDKRPMVVQSFYGNGDDVLLLSNHINAGGGDGAEVIYSLRNSDNLANKIANELSKTGQNIRKVYQRKLPSNPSKDYYYILRDTPNNESLIIEDGFADSNGDDVDLIKNRYEELAEAVVKAVTDYLGVAYFLYSNSNNTYMVQKGDSLWSIAKKFGISVDELKKMNQLSNNMIQIGQILQITDSKNNNSYIVQAGDTLYSISKKVGLSVEEIKSINGLSSNVLKVGQVLKFTRDDNPVEQEGVYIVQKGDTLYGIAKNMGVDVSSLMNVNQLTSNVLTVGQSLKIPVIEEQIYTVQRGDSLWKIAKQFQTTVDNIIKKNNLISNILRIGQKLLIP